jgi:hypothetical protein
VRIADCEVELTSGVRVSLMDALELSRDQELTGSAFVIVRADGTGLRVPPEVIAVDGEPDAVDVSRP